MLYDIIRFVLRISWGIRCLFHNLPDFCLIYFDSALLCVISWYECLFTNFCKAGYHNIHVIIHYSMPTTVVNNSRLVAIHLNSCVPFYLKMSKKSAHLLIFIQLANITYAICQYSMGTTFICGSGSIDIYFKSSMPIKSITRFYPWCACNTGIEFWHGYLMFFSLFIPKHSCLATQDYNHGSTHHWPVHSISK